MTMLTLYDFCSEDRHLTTIEQASSPKKGRYAYHQQDPYCSSALATQSFRGKVWLLIPVFHMHGTQSYLPILALLSASTSSSLSETSTAPSSSCTCSTEVALAIADVMPGCTIIQANATCVTVAE